ncbi:MAG: hypothetical protein DMG84_22320 [Acidobacteria bacterium]|nr:MAG: hypothetical protein DMG84_22320 [Acidobacteriota bacterium]
MGQRPLRLLVSFAGVAIVTFVANRLIPVNTTTVGFAYLLLVLVIASAWGFLEAALASVLATLLFNFFFFPPIGKFTIADPQNWVALFSFLATSLIASRLSAMAKRRALEAIERHRDLEHLYAFSRAMLLIDRTTPFPRQLVDKLAEIFELRAAVLFERNASVFYPASRGSSSWDVAFGPKPTTNHSGRASRLGADSKSGTAERNDARVRSPGNCESGRHRFRAGPSARSC